MKRYHFFWILIICTVGFSVYANSLANEFVWDDVYIVENNPLIKSFAFLPRAFTTGLFQAYGVGKGSFYRPLQILSYMIDYRFWGLSPRGYHLTNTILHIFCALLLYMIIISIVSDSRPALIAALLFVAHPLHTQAITYISGRADPLSVFFALVCLLCFIRFLAARGKIPSMLFYLASVISFILALLSKEVIITYPLFCLFYIFVFRKKIKSIPAAKIALSVSSFFVVVITYIALRFTVLDFFEGTFLAETPLLLRLLTTCKNIFAYIGLLIAPRGLHMEREVVFVTSFFNAKVVFSLVALFCVAMWMRWVRRRNPALFFFSGWFFLGLLPVSNIFPLNATLAEHWVYLPSMGIFALVGLGCVRALDSAKKTSLGLPIKLGVILILAGATITYGSITVRRNIVWRSPLSLYLDTKRYVPNNYKLRNNLGNYYLEQDMVDKAVKEYEHSVMIQPLYAQAHSNLGLAYATKGWDKKAIIEYKRALELIPVLSRTYEHLAKVYLKMGRLDKALEVYRKGITNCPQDSFLHSMFGLSLAESGELTEAIMQGKRSLELESGNAILHYNMAIIYEYNSEGIRYGKGFNFEQAKSQYLKAISLDKNFQYAHVNLKYLLSLQF